MNAAAKTQTKAEAKAGVKSVKRRAPEEIGIVASNKMEKTIVVKVTRRVKHPLYKKYVTKTKRVKAHDEKNIAGVGDQVLIVETRPTSKQKRYALKQVIRKARY